MKAMPHQRLMDLLGLDRFPEARARSSAQEPVQIQSEEPLGFGETVYGYSKVTLNGTEPAGSPRLAMGAVRFSGDVMIRQVSLFSGSAAVPGWLLAPQAPAAEPRPAILYCHAHGNRPDIGALEAVDGRPALLDPPLGVALARAGFVVLAVDMPGFGARRGEGSEDALSKAALWRGRTLIGDMVLDQLAARRALAGLPDVDASRIAAVGFSMGATLAYMTASVDDNICAAAHLCAFARIGPLIASGAHDLHGPYMTLPGLLPDHDLDAIAARVAPRPQLVCASTADALTPVDALAPALNALRGAYADCPEALTIETNGTEGHRETPRFRAVLLDFLQRTFRSVPPAL